MAYHYRVVYKETEETLEAVCELYDADNSELTMKVVAVGAGILVLALNFFYGDPGGGTLPGLLFFLVKYLISWAVLTAAAMFLNRTVWRKAVRATAAGDAQEMYRYRKAKNGEAVVSQIDFYEDRFESVTKIKKRAFEYGQVLRLLETERGFGLVIRKDKDTMGSPRALIGFPKEALVEGDMEELKEFLLKRCQGAGGKIKKL